MKKSFLMAGVILLAICITVSAVSADDSWSFNFSSDSETNTDCGQVEITNNHVKIQGFEFDIPEGYEANDSAKVVGEDAGDSFKDFKASQVRFDKGDDSIIIKVVCGDNELDDDSYTPDDDTVAKKINDVDGYFAEYDDGVSFDYIEDGKLVEIFAPDEKALQSLINDE